MDVEAGWLKSKDSQCDVTVFTEIGFKTQETFWYGRKKLNGDQSILDGACGAIRPGRLTFILGPSGAGKTTLLSILAKRKKTGVKGYLHGVRQNVILVSQHATLINTLTVKETLEFAAALKLPRSSWADRNRTIHEITKQLGIADVYNTRAGQLSGGERKRLTIATELLSNPSILLLDEPTSGLDSVSSMSVANALQSLTRSGRTVACVIHQPSSQLFATADDVLVLANGKTIYAGAIADIPQTLGKAGYICPQYYNIADYLLEIVSGEYNNNVAALEQEARIYANEMKKIADKEVQQKNEKDTSTEAEALLKNLNIGYEKQFSANVCQQMRALLWRGYIGALRDVHLTQIRVATHFVVALLLGALYHNAGVEADRMQTNTGCLFFFLLFIFFSNAMPTINSFPVESTVVLQEHLNKWYYLSTYCATKILVDLPVQLLCATVFIFPAWYLTSQPLEAYRLCLAWAICVLVTILAQTFGLVIGAAFEVKLGLFIIPASNIPMLMFSEFFIPYAEIPSYLQPFALISYFRYSFDAFMQIAYGFNRSKLPCHKVFCIFKNPAKYLEYLGISQNLNHDVIALVVWIILLKITLVCVLKYKVYKACR